jgi:arylsulfatase A-like enzyme
MLHQVKFVLITLISFYLFSACNPVSEKEKKQPNILFLFTDDQRYGTIGELHQDPVQTSNLDGLVKSGVTFTNSYILGAPHGAVCSPSRAMLMTGRHYFNIPVNVYAQWAVPVSERGKCDLLTFPEYFKANGYETFATGKQHNGTDWLERGFDKCKAVFLGGMTKHFGTKVKDFEPVTGWSESYADDEKFSSEVFADAAIGFLQNNVEEKPFLMYVAFTAPHDPRTAPEEFHKMYPPEQIELPPNFKKEHPFPIADMKIRDEKLAAFPRQKEEVKKHISDYYAMITATDVQIGRILDALKNSGNAENTIIVFSGDNGLAVGQHGLIGKQNVYEHSIKVPLVFCGPGIPENEKEMLWFTCTMYFQLCAD